jgi:hypothetical protein
MMGAANYIFADWTVYHELLQRQHALRHGYVWNPKYIVLFSDVHDIDEPTPDGPLWQALIDAVIADAAGCVVPFAFRAHVEALLRVRRGDLVPALVERSAPCRRAGGHGR